MDILEQALRFHRAGRSLEALTLLRQAVVAAPASAIAHYTLASVLSDLGRLDEALAACRSGLSRLPAEPNLHGLAADLLMRRQQPDDAAAHLMIALKHAPGHELQWQRLAHLLRMTALPASHARPLLVRALGHPAIQPHEIAGSVAATLCSEPYVAELAALTSGHELPRGTMLMDALARPGSDALLLALMMTAVVPNRPLERIFTGLRRALLLEQTSAGLALSPEAMRFSVALAVQAFLTDYAWFVTPEEETRVERLVMDIDDALHDQGASEGISHRLAIIASYQPLHRLAQAGEITRRDAWPEPMKTLFRIQISEPLEERALRDKIPRLTPVTHPVSRQVRAQYEENPYPRWIRAGKASNRVSLPDILPSIGGVAPMDPSFAAPEVLIAGCGTGAQAIVAESFYANAKILAVDLSLAYAWRRTRELGIGNIEYQQGDLLELHDLGHHFHAIECGGVLHHLADPLEGWRLLADLLYPGGIMNIGLYSAIARRTVVAAREYISARGYKATPADMRHCREDIFALPDDHPLASLRRMRDLYNLSECRDLLFHVQEHRFTLLEIRDVLRALDLRFLGFNSPDLDDAYRRRFPDDPRMTSLENWHVFEQEHPSAFAGMYNFWTQKNPS